MEVEITSATISQIQKRYKLPKLGTTGKNKQGQTVYLGVDEGGKGQTAYLGVDEGGKGENLRSKRGRKGEYKQKCTI